MTIGCMDTQQHRQAWIRSIIEREYGEIGKGAIGKFARAIEREPSYVSRMLYEKGKGGGKSIGEAMVEIIAAKFGPPPEEAAVAARAKSGTSVHEQRERDIAAQNMVILSLAHALMKSAPGAGKVFAKHLRAQAASHKPKPFATDFGLLGEVLGIAEPDQNIAASAAPRAKQLGSGKTTS